MSRMHRSITAAGLLATGLMLAGCSGGSAFSTANAGTTEFTKGNTTPPAIHVKDPLYRSGRTSMTPEGTGRPAWEAGPEPTGGAGEGGGTGNGGTMSRSGEPMTPTGGDGAGGSGMGEGGAAGSGGPVTYTPTPPAANATYVIQRGDTLWSIARRYYGDGQRWRDILAANPGLEPNRMRIGQEIILPAR